MERIQQVKSEWKLLISTAMAALSSYFQRLAAPLMILLGVMLLDYIAGIVKAGFNGEISSREAARGAVRKVGRLCLVAVGTVVDYILSTGLEAVDVALPFQMPVALLVCFWLMIGECISIVENLDAAGVPIPVWLMKLLKVSKEKFEQEEGKHESH